jgi:GNAT superfamily N-acetyltransferase
MSITVTEQQAPDWRAYAAIDPRFTVHTVLDARALPDGSFDLAERPVAAPWEKNYDAIPGQHPTSWPQRFDVSRWIVLLAHEGDELVGGAVVVTDARAVETSGNRDDLAVLWDLRVRPDWRGRGVGSQLFRAAADASRSRGKRELVVETQDINASACRFYARMGCELRAVTPGAYPNLPGEAQFLWFLRLT